MDTSVVQRTIAAPRFTAVLGLVLAVGVLSQGLFAGAFLQGDHSRLSWHETLGTLLVLPPLASLVAALALHRRHPDPPSTLVTRAFLLALVITTIITGHAGRDLLVVHVPAAIAVVAVAVRQGTGFGRIPNLGLTTGRDSQHSSPSRAKL